jgi:3-dehydroquinate dehydratase-2
MTKSTLNILILNGPNLNLLGQREPATYGSTTLKQITDRLLEQANQNNALLECFQTNAEHQMIERIQATMDSDVSHIIINPAAWTHTSVAIRDALLAVDIPFIEVHLSNIHQREAFRTHSYFSDRAQAVICGCGAYGYELAMQYILLQSQSAL